MDMVSKITDQNIKSVFGQLEKHKALMEDRFNRMEIQHERLKAQTNAIEQDNMAVQA